MPVQTLNLRHALRDETRASHDRLDARASQLDLSGASGYRAFLCWHGALVPGIEAHLGANGIEALVPDWGERVRTPALLADISLMGLPWPAPRAIALPETAGALIGIAYVLEGSRLGGAMLARTVDADLRGVATAYLDHGAGHKLWPRFVATLETVDLPGGETAAAIAAARDVFGLFERELDAHLQPQGADISR